LGLLTPAVTEDEILAAVADITPGAGAGNAGDAVDEEAGDGTSKSAILLGYKHWMLISSSLQRRCTTACQ